MKESHAPQQELHLCQHRGHLRSHLEHVVIIVSKAGDVGENWAFESVFLVEAFNRRKEQLLKLSDCQLLYPGFLHLLNGVRHVSPLSLGLAGGEELQSLKKVQSLASNCIREW